MIAAEAGIEAIVSLKNRHVGSFSQVAVSCSPAGPFSPLGGPAANGSGTPGGRFLHAG
jgi:hypothetical protein